MVILETYQERRTSLMKRLFTEAGPPDKNMYFLSHLFSS